MKEQANESSGSRVKIIGILIGAAALLAAAAWQFDLQLQLVKLLDWIAGLGAAGALVFIATYIVATVLFLPGMILTLGAGFLYGVGVGVVVVSAGSTLGATLAFLIGRYLARGWVMAKVSGNEKFEALDGAIGREGWKIVGLVRLSPIFPFNLLNYALGLTKVPLKHFVLASWIGMLPGTVMYVYIGSIAANLAALGAGREARTAGEWALYGLGLLATVAVTVFVTRIARRALREKVEKGDQYA